MENNLDLAANYRASLGEITAPAKSLSDFSIGFSTPLDPITEKLADLILSGSGCSDVTREGVILILDDIVNSARCAAENDNECILVLYIFLCSPKNCRNGEFVVPFLMHMDRVRLLNKLFTAFGYTHDQVVNFCANEGKDLPADVITEVSREPAPYTDEGIEEDDDIDYDEDDDYYNPPEDDDEDDDDTIYEPWKNP